jgi:hypothetical protein
MQPHEFSFCGYIWNGHAIQAVATLVGPILGALFAAAFAMWFFFRQKEYEIVRSRYLENGIDIIVQQAERTLQIFQFNWARALMVLKAFRDMGKDTPKELYTSAFLQIDSASLESSRHYLIKELVGDKIFFEAHQGLLAFMQNADYIFRYDLSTTIRLCIEGGQEIEIKATREQIYDSFFQQLKKLNLDANKYWIMLGLLNEIAIIFERQKFAFGSIGRFKETKEIRDILQNVRNEFRETLDKYKAG